MRAQLPVMRLFDAARIALVDAKSADSGAEEGWGAQSSRESG